MSLLLLFRLYLRQLINSSRRIYSNMFFSPPHIVHSSENVSEVEVLYPNHHIEIRLAPVHRKGPVEVLHLVRLQAVLLHLRVRWVRRRRQDQS